jgi:hypothetical protein
MERSRNRSIQGRRPERQQQDRRLRHGVPTMVDNQGVYLFSKRFGRPIIFRVMDHAPEIGLIAA